MAFSLLILLFAMASIQFGAAMAKQLFPMVGAGGTSALRLGLAALLLVAFWRPWRQPLSRPEKFSILIYGAALGGMNYVFYLAIERIPLGLAVALEFTGPLAVALWASRKTVDFLWAGLALAGILLLLPLGQNIAALDPLGVALALLAGLFWALYILFGKRAGASTHGGTVAAWGMLAAALFFSPVGAWQAGPKLLDSAILPMALAIAFFSSALPYSLEMLALQRIPAKTFGILMSLEPAMAALSGLLFLGETLNSTQWGAVVCIMLASFGSAYTARAPVTTELP